MPHALRYRLAYDAKLLGQVFGIFARVVFQLLRRKAREYSILKGRCGAVGFVQRFGSALNLHVHSHMLVLDGVYAALEGEAPRFYPLHAPEEREVAWVAAEVALRTAALLERLGRGGAGGEEDRLSCDDPWLAGLYSAGVRGTVATGARAGRRVQTAGHAGSRSRVSARWPALRECRRIQRSCECRDTGTSPRKGLETEGLLCDIHLDTSRGRLILLVLDSSILIRERERRPGARQVEATGCPHGPRTIRGREPVDSEAACTHAHEPEKGKARRRRNYAWAELMKRVWAVDVLECPRCFGRMRLVAAIHAEDALQRILEQSRAAVNAPLPAAQYFL